MLIGVSIYLLSACTQEKKAETIAVEKFLVTNPIQIDTVYAKEYVTDIQSIQNVELRSKTKGVIEKIYVDEGKYVSAGQILYSINNQSLRVELAKTEAQLKSVMAEKKTIDVELENTKKLVDKNVVAKSALTVAEAKIEGNDAKIDELKADVAGVKLQLSFSQIKAPFGGTISRLPLKVGAMVEEGTVMTNISNNKEVFAYFNVSEREYLNLINKKKDPKNNQVTLLLANNEVYKHRGVIETTDSEFDKNTGNIAFRARFINPDGILKNGSSGKVVLNQTLQNAIIIPQKSTFEVQDKIYVYVVNNKNIVETRIVTPVLRMDKFYVIEGLAIQDKIIYEGIQNVKEGEKVEAIVTPLRQIMTPISK